MGGNVGIGTTSPSYLLDVSQSNVAGVTDMRLFNSDTTSGASGARSIIAVGNGSSGDPRVVLAVTGVADYHIGIDNSDSDAIKIGTGSDPSAGTNILRMVSGFTQVTGEFYATGNSAFGSIGPQSNIKLALFSADQSSSTYSLVCYDSQGFSKFSVRGDGAVNVVGALSKGSGSFRIEHPLPFKSATHQLVHSFIEGPKCDLIYRGKVDLVDGKAFVNIDTDSAMTEGTFEALCATVQCFTSNESGWGAIRGKVVGNILTIEAQDAASTDNVSWMVIGERKDPHIMDTDWTDDSGRPIVEPLKPAEPALESK